MKCTKLLEQTIILWKFKEDIGWYPETSFEKGIALTINWYLENEEWMNDVGVKRFSMHELC